MDSSMNGDKELLTRIAWMYYYDDMNQQAIAVRLNINRVKVNRLLKRIRTEKIVRIEIDDNHRRLYSIEDRLRRISGLSYVVVVPSMNDLNDAVCRGVGHLLNDVLGPVGRLGLGLSRTLSGLSSYLDSAKSGIESVVSLSGTATPTLALTPDNAALSISQELGIDYFAIWSPVIAAPAVDAATVKKDKFIADVLNMAAASRYALVGIGSAKDSQLVETGYISEEELDEIKSRGVVGEIMGHYYTRDGRPRKTSVDHRIVAVDFPMKCPVIGAAGGADKALPTAGAILAGYIQGIVTDEETAESIIEELQT